MKTMKVKISGMSCKSCSDKIEKGLKELEGVKEVKVDLADDSAEITFDLGKQRKDLIEKRIEELGYSIEGRSNSKNETKKTLLQGIAYGLIPHIGCIGFIIASILGVTFAAEFFKPLLMNAMFFYGLIALSLVFATISSAIYLKNNNLLSWKGLKKKTNYLLVMYGTTIGVSMLFLFVIFPLLVTGISSQENASPTLTAQINQQGANQNLLTQSTPVVQKISLQVQIPCGGHTPLITFELKKIEGVLSVKAVSWNVFVVSFDSSKTSTEKILSAQIFKEYFAKVI
jgi:copper ion binding protein